MILGEVLWAIFGIELLMLGVGVWIGLMVMAYTRAKPRRLRDAALHPLRCVGGGLKDRQE